MHFRPVHGCFTASSKSRFVIEGVEPVLDFLCCDDCIFSSSVFPTRKIYPGKDCYGSGCSRKRDGLRPKFLHVRRDPSGYAYRLMDIRPSFRF